MDARVLHYGDTKNAAATICGLESAACITYRSYELLDDPPPAYVTEDRCQACRKILQAEADLSEAKERDAQREDLLAKLDVLMGKVASGEISFVAWLATGKDDGQIVCAGTNDSPVEALGMVSLLKEPLRRMARGRTTVLEDEDGIAITQRTHFKDGGK